MTIIDLQSAADKLYAMLGGPPNMLSHDGNAPQTEDDATIFETAKNAENGDKFLAIWACQWQDLGYPSQSECDFALYDILAWYTKNAEQIRRMFMQSACGARPKALRDDYHNYMLLRAFDRDVAPIDFEGFAIAAQIALDKHKAKEDAKASGDAIGQQPTGAPNAPASVMPDEGGAKAGAPNPFKRNYKPYTLPPGLVGDIARFIYETAPRPVEEIALASAIGLMAGICGRAYNVSSTGLNLYLLVLAETGHGKEVVASGIDALFASVEAVCPTVHDFRGPGAIASGTAIINALSKHQSMVSVIGEFGWRFKAMASDKASTADMNLMGVMLDLYAKSGSRQKLAPSVWADKVKNLEAIPSPAFSLICESVPSVFYGVVKARVIQAGLLPRFIIIDSRKPRQYLNAANVGNLPSNKLQGELSSLAIYSHKCAVDKRTVNVFIDPQAQARLTELDRFTTDAINTSNADITRHLWNRVHLNTMRLAALIAVGVNFTVPTITLEIFEWAADLVIHSTYSLLDRFEAGEIGEDDDSEHSHIKIIEAAIREYLLMDFKDIGKGYKVTREMFDGKVIPYSYLLPVVGYKIKGDTFQTRGTEGLRRALETMVNVGTIIALQKNKEMREKYKSGVQMYLVSNFAALGIGE